MNVINLRKPIGEIERPENISIFYKLSEKPVYMQVPLKSGCTYFKNLFYYLDHGEPNPLGDFIHDDETGLIKANADDFEAVSTSPYVFFIIRNPVSRFLSLYFDKIADPRDRAFNWFREKYGAPLGMKFGPDLSLEEHKANALIFIQWVGENIDRETDPYPDPHWQPQLWRYMQVRDFKPVLLPLDAVDEVLPKFLAPVIPDIAEAMKAVPSRNVSYKPFTHDEMRNWPMTKAIREFYSGDFRIYKKARKNAQKIMNGEGLDDDD